MFNVYLLHLALLEAPGKHQKKKETKDNPVPMELITPIIGNRSKEK